MNKINKPWHRLTNWSALLVFVLIISSCGAQDLSSKNGFDLSNASVAIEEILSGGPGKDGIPALDKPVFVDASSAEFLQDEDRVLALEIDGVSKAYPIKILNWHEIVNDRIGATAFAVTYCPLCGTGVVFSRQLDNQVVRFGVSGLLYNSDVLLYDDQTESLFSQILAQAISGPLVGKKLETLISTHTTWGKWRQLHPQSLVLSTATGYHRDYERNPYGDYASSHALYFPVASSDAAERFHPKETVLGLVDGNRIKAYPFSELDKQGRASFVDVIDAKSYRIEWDSQSRTANIFNEQDQSVFTLQSFYFAWMAFYPETRLFHAP